MGILVACDRGCSYIQHGAPKTWRQGDVEELMMPSDRVAKFDPKVGSQRTTKIKNLVVLVIILVVLILLPYYMYVVLLLITPLLLFLLVRET